MPLALPVERLDPAAGTDEGQVDRQGDPRLEEAKKKPLLPPEVEMSEETRERLIAYLDSELHLASAERQPQMEKFARLQEKYRAPFPDTPKDWPIPNASQITVPIIKTAVNTVQARLYQTVMAAEPLASVRTEDPELQPVVFDYERFLELYSLERMDMPEVIDRWVNEVVLLGTGILEPTTLTDRRALLVFDPETGNYTKQTIDRFDGPIAYYVPIEDFWTRPAYNTVEETPWCGKALRLTWAQIKDMALSAELNPEQINNIWRFQLDETAVPESRKDEEERSAFAPNDRDQYRIFELTVRWDIDNDGIEEELLLYFHLESRTLLRVKANAFRHGRRPWIKAVFSRINNWFFGEGLAEQLEHLQDEISTTHNQRIDNATLVNLRPILVRKLIQGLRPGDRLWTGKVIRVTNVKDDVGTIQLADVYPSTVTNEQIALNYVERLSGVGPAATGQAQPVSRTTATAQLALLEELNRRFDKALKSIRQGLRRVYVHINDLFIELGTGGLAELWLGPVAGRRLDQFLQLPHEILERKFKIQIVATRSTVNREVEFQTSIAVFQLIMQLWANIRNEAAQLAPQTVPVLAHEMVKAITPIFRKVMQYANAPDPDSAISVLTVLERILPKPEDMGGMASSQQGEDVAALEQLLRGAGAGGNGDLERDGRESERDAEIRRLASLIEQAGFGR